MPDVRVLEPMPNAGTGDHQRDLQRRLVGEQTMGSLAMVAQRFTMIGGDDDQAIRIGSENRSELRLQLTVDVGDFTEVFVFSIFAAERLRWRVRSVRVVEMNPHESLPVFISAPPSRVRVEHCGGRTLL